MHALVKCLEWGTHREHFSIIIHTSDDQAAKSELALPIQVATGYFGVQYDRLLQCSESGSAGIASL